MASRKRTKQPEQPTFVQCWNCGTYNEMDPEPEPGIPQRCGVCDAVLDSERAYEPPLEELIRDALGALNAACADEAINHEPNIRRAIRLLDAALAKAKE